MSRSVFQEVGEARAGAPKPEPGRADALKRRNRRALAVWLLILALMVAAQIVIGGLTRLTDSGLSITDWRPITGLTPPLSEQDWRDLFAAYQTTTEFQQQNAAMTLEQFKPLYWWEWGHRLFGRLIGVVFAAPFLWFAWKRMIPTGWTRKLLFVGALGLAQGVIGWWMVASGLVGRLDVSQHRLAVHLGLAFVILAVLLWQALSLRRDDWELLQARRRREPPLPVYTMALGALLFAQVLMGAYVSGLDGGKIYGDWPLMGGGFYPPGEPFQPFEAAAAAQFTHRLLAYLLLIAAGLYWWRTRRAAAAKTRLWARILGAGLLAQAGLGVLTVLNAAPVGLALAHQLTAILLAGIVTHAAHQNAYPREERISGRGV